MPKYYKLKNGNKVSQEELAAFAQQNGLSLEEVLSKNPEIQIVEDQSFQTGPVKETAVAGPMTQTQQQVVDQAISTVSTLEDTSSELQKTKPERYVIYNNKTVFEKDYEQYAGKDNYPKTFDDYANAIHAEIFTADPVEVKAKRPIRGKGKENAERNTALLTDQLGFSVFAGGNQRERSLANEKLQSLTGDAAEYNNGPVNEPDIDENTWDQGDLPGFSKDFFVNQHPGAFVYNWSGEIPEDVNLSFIDIPTARQQRINTLSLQEQMLAMQNMGMNYKDPQKNKNSLNREILQRGLDFLSDEEKTIYDLYQRYQETRDPDLLEQLKVYDEDYGTMLYDPTVGKLVNYSKASTAAFNIDSNAKQKAEQTDVNTLQSELTDTYYSIVGLAKDLRDYQEQPGIDIFENRTLLEVATNGAVELFGGKGALSKDIEYLKEIAVTGELPKNLTFLPGNHPYVTAFNEQLQNYLVLNKALKINRDPATIQQNDVAGEFVDGMVELLGAESVVDPNSKSVKTTANNFVQAVFGAEYEPDDSVKENLEKTISESVAHGVPEFGAFVAEIAATKKLSASTVGKGFNYLERIVKKMPKKTNWQRIKASAANLMLKSNEEATYFVLQGELFSDITKPSEEVDAFESYKFGLSLGVGNVFGKKILDNISWKYFTPMTKLMAESRGTRALFQQNAGALTGSATFQFAQLTTDWDQYLDKSFEDIGKEFLTEYSKMMILGSKSLFGRNGMIREFRNDILNMRSESVETNAIAKEWGINKDSLKQNPEEATAAVDNIVDAKTKAIEEDFSSGKINKQERDAQIKDVQTKQGKLEFQIALNEAQRTIKVEREGVENQKDSKGNKLAPTNAEIFILTEKLRKGEKLNERDNYVLANTDVPLILKTMGITENMQIAQSVVYSSAQARAIEDVLSAEKTQYGGADRKLVYDYLQEGFALQDKIQTLKEQPNKTESDKNRIAELEKQMKEQYDENGEKWNLLQEKRKAITEERYAEDIAQARALVQETLEGELVETSSAKEFQNKYEEAFPESKENKTDTNGFYDPNTKIFYINTERVKKIHNVTTATHEVGHFILRNSLKDENNKVTQEGIDLIDQVLDKLTPQQRAVVENRINENYKLDKFGNERAKGDYYEEYLTALSEAIKSKQIVFNEEIGSSLLNFVPRLRKSGFESLEINTTTAEGLFNLIKSYSTGNISGAAKVSKEAEAAAKEKEATKKQKEVIAANKKMKAQESIEMTNLLNDLTSGKITEQEYEQKLDNLLNKVETRVTAPKSAQDLIGVIKSETEGSTAYNQAVQKLRPQFIKMGLKAAKFDPTISDAISKKDAEDWVGGYFLDIIRSYTPDKGSFSNYVYFKIGKEKSKLYEGVEKAISTKSINVEKGETGYVSELKEIQIEQRELDNVPDDKIKTKIQPKKFLNKDSQIELEAEVGKTINDENFVFEDLTFKNVPNIGAKLIAKEIGVREEQITDPKKNLNTATLYEVDGKFYKDNAFRKLQAENPNLKVTAVQESEVFRAARFIKKAMRDGLYKVLPEYNVAPELGAFGPEGYKNTQGTSLGVMRNVLNNFYETAKDANTIKEEINPNDIKTFERWYAGKRSAGLTSQGTIVRKKNLSLDQINDILDFKRPEGLTDKQWESMQDKNAQLVKGVLEILGKTATNSEIRKQLEINSEEVSALSAGKSAAMFSESSNKAFVDKTTEEIARLALYKKDGSRRERPVVKNVKELMQGLADIHNNALESYMQGNFEGFLKDLAKKENQDIADVVDHFFGNRPWELAVYADQQSRNKGKIFEDFVEKAIKAAKIEGLEVIRGSENPNGPGDITLKVGNQILHFELKLNDLNSQQGGYSNTPKSSVFKAIKDNVYVQNMSETLQSEKYQQRLTDFYDYALDYAQKNGFTAFMNRGEKSKYNLEDRLYADPEVWNHLVLEGKQAKLTETLETDASVIIDIYNHKGVNYVNYGNKGLFVLGEDIVNIGAEPIQNQIKEGDAAIVSRMVQSSTSKITGLKTASIRSQSILLKSLENSNVRLISSEDLKNITNKMKQNQKLESMSSVENIDKTFNENLFALNKKYNPKQKVTKSEASIEGAKVDADNKWKYYSGKIAPEANDFLGLLYDTLLPGEAGKKQKEEYKAIFTTSYNRAYNLLDKDQLVLSANYKQAKKAFRISDNFLQEKVGNTYFRNEDAVRVFIWQSQGMKVPEITNEQKLTLLDHVKNNQQLKFFANSMRAANGKYGFAEPRENWIIGGLKSDMSTSIKKINRPDRLKEWQSNVNTYFSQDNLNKMESSFGTRWVTAMKNSLERQRTGENRQYKMDSQVGKFVDQLSGSVLNTLNWNNKSALLQLTSAGNFINWTDNNPLAVGRAFANQPQYWKDFSKLFFSDFLKERRSGLQLDLNEQDIADLAKSKGFSGFVAKMLKLGMTPTVIADNIAIAGGGATFYRNRIKTYLKEGFTQEIAERKAYDDFRENAETTQQSSRPDKVSMQQSGPLGRIVLAYTNTPQQYMREMQKSLSDIKNGRGDYKTNVSKVLYYGFMQNFIFTGLQQGVNGLLFDDEQEIVIPSVMSDEEYKDYLGKLKPEDRTAAIKQRKEELKEKAKAEAENRKKADKSLGTVNSMLDTGLKGLGFYGSVLATLKNAAYRSYLESLKDRPDYADQIPRDLLAISPGLSIKYGQIRRGIGTLYYNEEEIKERGLGDLNNPIYQAGGDLLAGFTNVPINRYITKANNISNAMNEELSMNTRILSLGGWSEYALGIPKEEWEPMDPETTIKLKDHLQKMMDRLDPVSRGLYYKWKKEFDKRQKEKNKK